jgi:hypothetical protein
MRPLGVTLSAYFEFVRAALMALLALGALLLGGMASRFAGLAAEGNSLQGILSGLSRFIFVALLMYARITLALGVGLLLGQNWARLLTVTFSALGCLTPLPKLLHHHPLSSLLALANLAVLIYMLLPQTREYFQRKNAIEVRPI